MIALDTNILARFYCDDPEDDEATRQRPLARRLMVESASLFVPLTVILEFDMPNATVERWQAVQDAMALHLRSLDFANALHWACSAGCESLATFDDRGFARRARRFGLVPEVRLAK